MTVLDNIMTGRTLKMHADFCLSACITAARGAGIGASRESRADHRFLQIESIRKTPWAARLRPAETVELGRATAAEPELLLLDDRWPA